MTGASRTPDHYSLWLLTLGPTIWMTHLLLSYATAAIWCGKVAAPGGALNGVPVVIGWYTGVALVGLFTIAWVGFRRHRYVSPEAQARIRDAGSAPPRLETGGTEATTHDLDTPEDRYRFLGFATLLLAGLSALGVTYAAVAATYFDTCR